ncbi:uncharacterized protein ACR2FA_008808 [Aphomia sociella]
MAQSVFKQAVITILYMTHYCQAMIMRNNALMTKMMTHFNSQKENSQSVSQHSYDSQRSDKVLSLMQNVLCKNFPSIPCQMIMEDEALRKLIEKSIQQIKHKKLSLDKTTSRPDYHLTLFPIVNSEDLSNFLHVQEIGYYRTNQKDTQSHKKKPKKIVKPTITWSHEKQGKPLKKVKKDNKRTFTGRKKIRKFYPHKIKYKDKMEKNIRNFVDYSDEKLSMSVEIPDMTLTKRHQHLNYKVEPADPPVWRIDYTKHGEPSLNMLGYEADQLKRKIMKTGPNVIVDENILEQAARKDVLHPDVYIKKNFVRKNVDMTSGGMD